MTIDEAFSRVVRGHWLVILLCILVPFGVATYLGRGQAPQYEAVARVQMGTELASSNVQADATSQRVLGIATSPGVVRMALDKAGLQADVATFAANNIDVRRVGVSPVMEIAVTDTSPRRAAVIASSLTDDVIEFSNVSDQPTMTKRRADLQGRLDALTKQRAQLVTRLATAGPGEVLAIQAQLGSLTTTQGELERQLSDLDVASLTSSKAVLLDPVRQPTVPLPQDVNQRAVLLALIGALVGVGVAAAIEAFRPRLPTPRAVARALDVPHVGHLPRRDLGERTRAAVGPLADRIALLSRRHDPSRLLVVPVDEREEAWASELAPLLVAAGPDDGYRIDASVLARTWVGPGEDPVVVVLAPDEVRVRDLARTTALVDALGWPVVGMVSYPRRRWWQRGRGRASSAVTDAEGAGTHEEQHPATVAAAPAGTRAVATDEPAPPRPRWAGVPWGPRRSDRADGDRADGDRADGEGGAPVGEVLRR